MDREFLVRRLRQEFEMKKARWPRHPSSAFEAPFRRPVHTRCRLLSIRLERAISDNYDSYRLRN